MQEHQLCFEKQSVGLESLHCVSTTTRVAACVLCKRLVCTGAIAQKHLSNIKSWSGIIHHATKTED